MVTWFLKDVARRHFVMFVVVFFFASILLVTYFPGTGSTKPASHRTIAFHISLRSFQIPFFSFYFVSTRTDFVVCNLDANWIYFSNVCVFGWLQNKSKFIRLYPVTSQSLGVFVVACKNKGDEQKENEEKKKRRRKNASLGGKYSIFPTYASFEESVAGSASLLHIDMMPLLLPVRLWYCLWLLTLYVPHASQ